MNWFDSKSTIRLVFMLEECKRGLGVRLVKRYNTMKSLMYPCFERGTSIITDMPQMHVFIDFIKGFIGPT